MKRLYEIKEADQTREMEIASITKNMETLFGEKMTDQQAMALYLGIKRFEGIAATEKMNRTLE